MLSNVNCCFIIVTIKIHLYSIEILEIIIKLKVMNNSTDPEHDEDPVIA